MTTPGSSGGNLLALPPFVVWVLAILGAIGVVTAILEYRQARKTGVI